MSGTEAEKSLLDLEQVVQAVDGIHLQGAGAFSFTSVQTDSRAVEPGSFFVPLLGEHQDGHAYIPQAVERGAGAIFVRLRNYEAEPAFFTDVFTRYPHVHFIGVEDTLSALQRMAACYVAQFPDLIRVGITGSSGKTTTKEIAVALLSQKYRVVTNKGNLNSETGLPLSVFAIRREHQVGVFELGMNRVHEMEEIAGVLKPRFAVVTNIGTAHIGRLGSREKIAAEKAGIFAHFHSFGTAIIPRDDDFADFLASQVDGNVVYYGDGVDERMRLVADRGLEGTEFTVDGIPAHLALPGRYNYVNALGAATLALVLGLDGAMIAEGIRQVRPEFGRGEIVRGRYTIIQDCYNANPDSMEKAIGLVASASGGCRRALVLGDMLELGEESARAHEAVGLLAAGSGADCVVFVGDEMQAAAAAARAQHPPMPVSWVAGGGDGAMREAAGVLRETLPPGAVILLKGSRGMRLERMVRLLEDE